MKKEGIDKVTEMVNKEVKSTSRGEKCLAKFTASNGNVYGSLTLDIRKAGEYSQPLPVAVRVCHAGQKVFLRWVKHTPWKNGWFFVVTRKVVVVFN